MVTLREFILEQSTLPTGNAIRDHLGNSVPEKLILTTGFEIEISNDLIVEIETNEYEVEVC